MQTTALGRFVQFFAKNTALTSLLWLGLIGFGLASYVSLLPREGFPSVDVPIAVAGGGYFVDDPAKIDAEISVPLTEAILTKPGVERVQSFTSANSFTIVVSLEQGSSSAAGVDAINQSIAEIEVPADALVEARAINASKFLEEFDLLVGVVGPADATAEDLEAAASQILEPFEEQANISRAAVAEQITSGINPATGEEITEISSFNQLTITNADSQLEVRPSIAVGVVAADGADSLAVRDASDVAVAKAQALLPAGYEAKVSIDQATLIRTQVGSLQRNVLTGILAVAAVALVLISWRASIITALFIITVIATTMGVLYLVGISLNTISLFGVILALGLFVDDAIVITEAIDTFREDSSDPLAIIGHAIKRVGAASVSGTITTVLVFAPMLAISGILGEFIRILPISVMVALVSSLLLSLIFIPFAARYLVLPAPAGRGPLAAIQDKVANTISGWAGLSGKAGVMAAIFGVGVSLAMTAIGFLVFLPNVGFNIFPPQKDSIELTVSFDFEPGSTIEQSQAIAQRVNQQAVEALGDEALQVYTWLGDAESATGQIVLTDMGDRPTAPELVELLTPVAESTTDAEVKFSLVSTGPPDGQFPFLVQIFGDDPEVLSAAAAVVEAELSGASVERVNGTTFNVVETLIAFEDSIARDDGRRLVEVRARFDADDTTTTTAQTQAFIEEKFPTAALAELGLEADALGFDFGFESENQESFESMGRAFIIALGGMLILLIFQFRSTVQWILVLLAIPFSFFGVFGGLLITNNELSFFVMLGLLGLIGIAVNNTILLTDFANQERRAGADRKTAIQTAVKRRFRPLVATSLTTVAGVLPLALSDPFWEALGYTIIFGLLSSTFLVLVSFPFYYLGIEYLRDRIRTPWRRFSM